MKGIKHHRIAAWLLSAMLLTITLGGVQGYAQEATASAPTPAAVAQTATPTPTTPPAEEEVEGLDVGEHGNRSLSRLPADESYLI
jgi:hypothetical protein